MEQIPWELEEKILSMIPTVHIARSRCVCKRWKTFFDKSKFFDTDSCHARPQFILLTESKICSIDVNLDGPSIEMHNLPSDIPGYEHSTPMTIEYCDGLLIYATCYGTGICNPWLRHIKWIKPNAETSGQFTGMGYDNSKAEKHYKIFESYHKDNTTVIANITEFGSHAWKSYELASDNWYFRPSWCYSISLNGTLYWIAINNESYEYFIQSFDFSTERFKPYCMLPRKFVGPYDARSLAVFRRDRFSFFEQDRQTRNIKIWVTKEKIKNGNGDDVEWINLMNVSVPKLSSLHVTIYPPSYFIDDESHSLVLCCYNNERKAYIYIANNDKFHEIKINDLVDDYPLHRTYFPSLIPVPTFTMSSRGHFAVPRGIEASNGDGENEWDDGIFDNVRKIYLRWDDFGMVFVKFEYFKNNAVVDGIPHGSVTNIPNDYYFKVKDDDYIEAVEGTYTESRITCIMFRLHKSNEILKYGFFEGTPFVLGGGQGSKIIGFYGRSSDTYITALGVHFSDYV